MMVHPDYQGKGIAGEMLERPERCWNVSKKNIRTTYNIDGMPEDEKNVPSYEKHGFQRMEHGAAIQICNYSDKR